MTVTVEMPSTSPTANARRVFSLTRWRMVGVLAPAPYDRRRGGHGRSTVDPLLRVRRACLRRPERLPSLRKPPCTDGATPPGRLRVSAERAAPAGRVRHDRRRDRGADRGRGGPDGADSGAGTAG